MNRLPGRRDHPGPYSAGRRRPQAFGCVRLTLRDAEGHQPAIETKEDLQGMANAENGIVSPDVLGTPPAPGRTRSGRPSGPTFKPMQRDDVSDQEMADLISLYDDSFKNMAEG